MYPFATPSSIVRNRWYIAAFSNEITREPIERKLLGLPVALYRKESGEPVAMYGLCPHRYYPLALGKLQGDALVCGYHGFVFQADGKCSEIPSQGTGAGFCQPTYQIVEKGPLCWIWMGDADECDSALIPPYADFGLGEPGWRYSSANYFHLKGRSQLLVDNLMDLTHLPYVHHHIGGGEAMKNPSITEEERGAIYRVSRTGKVPYTPFHELVFGPEAKFEGFSDFLSLTDFYGPEFIRTSLPITTAVNGQDSVPEALGALYILHGITPETETTTHYFGFSMRNFRLDSEELDAFQHTSDCKIRQQDVDAIDAVERELDEAAARQRELLVRSDAPAVKVRRRIAAMLEAEQVLAN
ncbi:aromatic ring-hydroxylating dioxygenase subunit alpha [Novosphingobium mathurense]|uniref:Vanillate O-demethylase monooxygenase subunit n=1 Tax=Novosphingobium mathurense TaxID=428990 RepID=A0A1U6ILS1_9SPHN|nr:aromatic ring-hydroxylating dioxygenase subunit alpha [Novosphingobium mathurense]SLK08960.1 vanillate O-demethylase monooxygenase subunit [Novosphingobium mathurense]